THDLRVGRPGTETGRRGARRATLRVRVLRARTGDVPVVGTNDENAKQIAREQIAIANEVWVQCFVTFGQPQDADVAVVDPPPPALVSIADSDGLPARGNGWIRLRVNHIPIRPVVTHAGSAPIETALNVAAAIRAAGFTTRVTENPATEFGAGASADILVR